MTWPFVKGAQETTGSGTSASVSLASAIASGDVAVGLAFLNGVQSNTISSITDDKSNSYTVVTGSLATTTSNWSTILFWSGAALTNGPITLTANSSTSLTSFLLTYDVFTPPAGALSVDVSSGASGSTTANGSSSLTTTVNGDLVYGGIFVTGVGTLAGGSGFTVTENNGSSFAAEFQNQSTAGTISVTFPTPGGADTWTVSAAAFKAAAGGSPYNPWPQLGPVTAQKRKSIGWLPFHDHRRRILRPKRVLILPNRKAA